MKGHVLLSHGLDSTPDATKVSALAETAEALGWSTERLDYRDIDARRDLQSVQARLERLEDSAQLASKPLVLAGSSLGAFISALASLEVECVGLFLMVPPISLDGYPRTLDCADVPLRVIHAWDDELIPAGDVIRWCQPRRARLTLVDDSHRLKGNVDACAEAFGRFLTSLGR